jgi:hypothetical protein
VTGRIAHRKDGQVSQVNADDIEPVDWHPLRYKDIADPNFTGGLRASEYITTLWDEDG